MNAPPVFQHLVGQEPAVATLTRAASAASAVVRGEVVEAGAMTHAWLFTGPPGSGRSVAARAFAAALQCPNGGCGECAACHTTLGGTHADVRFVVPEGLSIGVNEMRSLVLRAASSPTQGRWQVLLVEDADRLTEQAGNALLKAVEEPPPRTVFLLCTPSTHPDDISVTIRSRCRVVTLRQPPAEAVAAVLSARDGVPARHRHLGGGRRAGSRRPRAPARRRPAGPVPPRRGARRAAPAHRHRRLLRRGERADRGRRGRGRHGHRRARCPREVRARDRAGRRGDGQGRRPARPAAPRAS
jgi:DNA polymerase-3 subunit delta'